MRIIPTSRFRRFLAGAAAVVAIAGLTLAVGSASAQAAVSTTPVCQNNGWYPGGKTCIQLVDAGFGSYGVKATGTVTSTLDSAWLTVTGASGIPSPSTPAKLAAGQTASFTPSAVSAAGKWCAVLNYKAPFIGTTWTATNSPAPCVTVPGLPAPAGSAKQVCTQANYPQFETCIDVVGGAVVAKGYTSVGSPSAWLVLTPPSGATLTGPATAITAGQTLTYAGPAPAAAGKWCASFWNKFPALPVAVNVSGSSPACLTV